MPGTFLGGRRIRSDQERVSFVVESASHSIHDKSQDMTFLGQIPGVAPARVLYKKSTAADYFRQAFLVRSGNYFFLRFFVTLNLKVNA